jgi:tRNA G18 (ribose-2'-O)-methylase SpoU
MEAMQRIESLDDPRVAAYRNLRDRTLRGESIFVTEGELLTLRLLQSRCPTESVFAAESFAERFRRATPSHVPLYVADPALLREIVGFNFHRGVLGMGRRAESPPLDSLLAGREQGRLSLIVCPQVTQPENLGLIFRTAGGLGADAVVLGPTCCDPLSRRCLRLSMGGSLAVPFARSADLAADLARLREAWGVETVATTLDPAAQRLDRFAWPRRTALLFGNEFEGLKDDWLALCDHRVTIPMHSGTDSLNLGVAAGIFVYDMMRASR